VKTGAGKVTGFVGQYNVLRWVRSSSPYRFNIL